MKSKMGVKNLLSPMPAILIGANINNIPNYITVAHCGIAAAIHITISLRKGRFTAAGIKENGTFSVNIPAVNLVKETDYCGLFSGNIEDKSNVFHSFYGTLSTAPMIEECPVNMECRLKQTVEFTTHELFIGEIVETYCEDHCFHDGFLDLGQVKPILYSTNNYWNIGEPLARAFEIGKSYKK